MPSNSRRRSRRQQKLVDSTPTSRAAHDYSSPKPYHDNAAPPPPPPAAESFQDRNISTDTKLSDITMDERSVFEYSDTSDDADAYFLPTESLRGAPGLLDNYNGNTFQGGRTRNMSSSSGESAFRDMKEKGSKSTKIVRFGNGSELESGTFDDEDTMAEEEARGRPLFGRFMKQMVHAFNTPSGIQRKEYSKKSRSNKKSSRHNRSESTTVTEYPYSMINLRETSQKSASKEFKRDSPEKSPLLGASTKRASYGLYDEAYDDHPLKPSTRQSKTSTRSEGSFISGDSMDTLASSREEISVIKSRTMATKVAAYFLMDYEASRIAALPSTFEIITERQLTLYRTYYSWQWRYFVHLAIIGLFLAHTLDLLTTAVMHSCVIVVLAIEIHIREGMYGVDLRKDTKHPDRKLVRPMVAFLFLLGLETWMWYCFSPTVGSYAQNPPIYSSFLKPIVLFYVSAKARDSLEAIWRISKTVIRVLLIESVLILIFAAFAQGLFGHNFDEFMNLQTSWLSLFKRE